MRYFTALVVVALSPLLTSAVPIAAPSPKDLSTLSLEDALITVFSQPSTSELLPRDLPSTENGLTTDPCKALTFIFARGTSEDGNVGARVGPQVISALRTTLGTDKVTAQGVDYAANVFGFLAGGDPEGTKTMISLVNTANTKCPSTKIVLGGYSQGAQLVHDTAKALSAAVSAKIVAVVMFGDPDYGQAVGTLPASEVDSICHARDIICTKTGDFTTHLTYDVDAPAAAAFIVQKSGL